jgi:hypothetical protein
MKNSWFLAKIVGMLDDQSFSFFHGIRFAETNIMHTYGFLHATREKLFFQKRRYM